MDKRGPGAGDCPVNVGDLLEALQGPLPRQAQVVVPEQEIRGGLRGSPSSLHPDDAVVCEPWLGPTPLPARTARQHLENRFAATYEDNSQVKYGCWKQVKVKDFSM